MGVFKEMKSEDIWKAVEGHEDVITPELRREEAFRNQAPCVETPTTSLSKIRSTHSLPRAVLPNKLLLMSFLLGRVRSLQSNDCKAPTVEPG